MITLRPLTDHDQPFVARLYRSTREEELAATGWTEPQKAAFAAMQLFAQTTDYQHRYPGATYELIQYHGQAAGRLLRWESRAEVRIIDISCCPSSGAGAWAAAC